MAAAREWHHRCFVVPNQGWVPALFLHVRRTVYVCQEVRCRRGRGAGVAIVPLCASF